MKKNLKRWSSGAFALVLAFTLFISCVTSPVKAFTVFSPAEMGLISVLLEQFRFASEDALTPVVNGIMNLLDSPTKELMESFDTSRTGKIVLTEEGIENLLVAVAKTASMYSNIFKHKENKSPQQITSADIGYAGQEVQVLTQAELLEALSNYAIYTELEMVEQNTLHTKNLVFSLLGEFQTFKYEFEKTIEHLQLTVSTIRVNAMNETRKVQSQLAAMINNEKAHFESLRNVEVAILDTLKTSLTSLQTVDAAVLTTLKTDLTSLYNVESASLTILKDDLGMLRELTAANYNLLKQGFSGKFDIISEKLTVVTEKLDQLLQFFKGEPGDTDDDDDDEDDKKLPYVPLQSATNQLKDANKNLKVDKPEIGDVSASSLVPYVSLVALSAPFLALWENEVLLAMLTIVVTLAMVSWVFFGKKA